MVGQTLTFILAGGHGTRLYPLTATTAKPLLPFGAIYRILDFTLSNCRNSELSQTYLLTQFDAESVQRYVASGYWKEFICLPSRGGNSYRGTADAVFRNRPLIESVSPELVLVLCADHIYKMDYRKLLQFHVRKGGDVTVAAVEYPVALANQFGVIDIDAHDQIVGFDEKPKRPRPMPSKPSKALVSMGIYVFNTEMLLRKGTHWSSIGSFDFGKDVIPEMIRSHRVNAYNFTLSGSALGTYWRDVGAIDTYYRSQMELLLHNSPFDCYNNASWPIHTSGGCAAFHSVNKDGSVNDSAIANDCRSEGARVTRSVVGPQTRIEPGAEVQESVIMAGARVGRSARLRRAIVQEGANIPDYARIGFDVRDDHRQYFVTQGGVVVVDPERCPEPSRLAIA
jgi:glucose-1-phosphate adenylyltransferase